MARKLQTVATFATERGLTEAQVRHLLARRLENGMVAAGVALQLGRRVMLDGEKFDAWLDAQQPQAIAA
jgi:hypothetical protein